MHTTSETSGRQNHRDICSHVDVQEFVASGGRILHIPASSKRMITVAYERYVSDSGTPRIRYGGTIHQKEGSSDNYVRTRDNRIAIDRLRTYPVDIPDGDFSPRERAEMIRHTISQLGVYSRD